MCFVRCKLRALLIPSLPPPSQCKGAKEKVLTRIMVSRCEVDLRKIRGEYKTQYGESLHKTIFVSMNNNPPSVSRPPYTLKSPFFLWFGFDPTSFFCRLCRNTPRGTTRGPCSACVEEMIRRVTSQTGSLISYWKKLMLFFFFIKVIITSGTFTFQVAVRVVLR